MSSIPRCSRGASRPGPELPPVNWQQAPVWRSLRAPPVRRPAQPRVACPTIGTARSPAVPPRASGQQGPNQSQTIGRARAAKPAKAGPQPPAGRCVVREPPVARPADGTRRPPTPLPNPCRGPTRAASAPEVRAARRAEAASAPRSSVRADGSTRTHCRTAAGNARHGARLPEARGDPVCRGARPADWPDRAAACGTDLGELLSGAGLSDRELSPEVDARAR